MLTTRVSSGKIPLSSPLTFSCLAACLLFSSEKLVKLHLRHLALRAGQSGDFKEMAVLMVSLTVTCDRLGNTLEQGVSRILRFAFSLLGGVPQLRLAFLAELRRRMWLNEVTPTTITQLGIFATNEVIKKEGWD